MMRTKFKFALLGIATFALSTAAFAQQVVVEANKSTALKIKGEAASIVIGNPRIADVAVHNANLIFVTGKLFGTTNLLIYSQDGRKLYSGDIIVTTNTSNFLSVNRAGQNNTYECAPRCRPVLAIGDDQTFFNGLVMQEQGVQAITNNNNN